MRKKLPEAFVDPEVLPPPEEVRVVFVLLGVVGSLVVVLVVVLGVSVVPATCAFFLSAACFFNSSLRFFTSTGSLVTLIAVAVSSISGT